MLIDGASVEAHDAENSAHIRRAQSAGRGSANAGSRTLASGLPCNAWAKHSARSTHLDLDQSMLDQRFDELREIRPQLLDRYVEFSCENLA